MHDIWNDVKFLSPPVNTYKCLDKNFDVSRLYTFVSDAISILESQQMLHREAAIVSRLIYSMGRKLRHDIGHSYVRRTNTALLKYLNLNYITDIKNLLSVIPEIFHEDYVYLPTRQMLEYVLVRTQTLAKILFRINMCAKKAALFYYERLKRGDSAWLSIMPFSVLARVWFLTKKFLKSVCKWYNDILPFASKLHVVGVPIIPSEYKFPSNLSMWINLKELDVNSSNLWKSSDLVSQFVSTEIEQELESNQEKNILDIDSFVTPITQIKSKRRKNEDIGEKISRNNFVKMLPPPNDASKNDNIDSNKLGSKNSKCNQRVNGHKENVKLTKLKTNLNNCVKNSNKNMRNDHCIESVKSLKSFKEFFKVEEALRIENSKKAVSRNIGIMQWQSLKKTICKSMFKFFKRQSDASPEIISKLFQTLWQERCT